MPASASCWCLSMNKHTPGPWFVKPILEDRGFTIVTQGNRVVASVSGASLHRADPMANAALVALAPEMLAAIQEVLEAGWRHDRLEEALDRRREAHAALRALLRRLS